MHRRECFENLTLSACQHTSPFMKTGVQLSCSQEPAVTKCISRTIKTLYLKDYTNVRGVIYIGERQ